jgi:flagellar hook-associated protein 3 FlgL
MAGGIGTRITPAMVTASTLNDLNATLSALQRSSNELSSGHRILTPSDDPYGASHVIDLQSQLDGLAAYESAAKDGTAWTQAATGAMGNISDILQRVRELIVQASNGTYNPEDLKGISTEVTQLTEAVKQDANTQYAGQYIFSGTATLTSPYQQGTEDVYQGNAEGIARAVGPGMNIPVSTNLSSVLGNGAGTKDGKLLDVLRTIAQHLNEGTPEARAELANDMKNLDGNMEALTSLQAVSGSSTEQLQTATGRIESLQSAITQALSSTQDADIAKTSTNFSNEQAAYSAALRAAATIVQESLLNFLH